MRPAALRSLALAALLACTRPRTEVVIGITTDFEPTVLRSVGVTVFRGGFPSDGGMRRWEMTYDATRGAGPTGGRRFLGELGVERGEGSPGTFWIEVRGCRGDNCGYGESSGLLVVRRAVISFVPEETRAYEMFLARSCEGVLCADDPQRTCRAETPRCEPALARPEELAPYASGAFRDGGLSITPDIPQDIHDDVVRDATTADGGADGGEDGGLPDRIESDVGDGGSPPPDTGLDSAVVRDVTDVRDADTLTCQRGRVVLGGRCVDPDVDPEYCGNMPTRCMAGPGTVGPWCAARSCWARCLPGRSDCDRNVANGCETGGTSSGIARLVILYRRRCALMLDGTVRCWGLTGDPALGIDTPDIAAPQPVCGLGSVRDLVGGASFSCALQMDRQVRCWGLLPASAGGLSAPTLISGLDGAPQLAAGGDYLCARLVDGTVRCMGNNSGGQLGDGTTTPRSSPVNVPELSGVVSVVAAGGMTCALTQGGTVSCWGASVRVPTTVSGVSDIDRLFGATPSNSSTRRFCGRRRADRSIVCWAAIGDAEAVPGLTDVEDVEIRSDVACARRRDETLWCWGSNSSGQLGDGTQTRRSTPAPVIGLAGVIGASLQDSYGCAWTRGGEAYCWGSNDRGVLGDGTTEQRLRATRIASLSGVTQIATSESGACALAGPSAAYCWGLNQEPVGIGVLPNHATPTRLIGITDATNVVYGGGFACVQQGTSISCWNSSQPVPVRRTELEPVRRIIKGGRGFCVLRDGIAPRCMTSISLPGLRDLTDPADLQVSNYPSSGAACALGRDRVVRCAGNNSEGILGTPPGTGARDRFEPVPGVPLADALAMGGQHACALANGTVYCWGDNDHAQLGRGSVSPTEPPAAVQGLPTVAEICSAFNHVCARTQGGEVYCWGHINGIPSMSDGGLGTTTIRRADLPGFGGAVSIHCGPSTTCALNAARELRCWGRNSGNGDVLSGYPVAPFGMANVHEVVFPSHSSQTDVVCARLVNGDLYCWGENQNGVVGSGSRSDYEWIPVRVLADVSFVSILEHEAICAGRSNGSLWCWGTSLFHGSDDAAIRLRPTAVLGLP